MKHRSLVTQFIKYAVVGGVAFAIDFLVMTVICSLILRGLAWGLYAGVAVGFFAGTAVNYLLSSRVVFNGMDGKARSSFSEFFQYALIGLAGMGITELCMYLGTELFCLYYGVVKVVAAGIVLVWNFCARRFLLYR